MESDALIFPNAEMLAPKAEKRKGEKRFKSKKRALPQQSSFVSVLERVNGCGNSAATLNKACGGVFAHGHDGSCAE